MPDVDAVLFALARSSGEEAGNAVRILGMLTSGSYKSGQAVCATPKHPIASQKSPAVALGLDASG